MGHKHSVHRVSVVVNAPLACGKIDKVSFSYRRKSCLVGRRKVIATLSLPESGWQPLTSTSLQNTSAHDANVRLRKLNKKDPNTPVTLECLAQGHTVLKATLALGDFLAGLRANEEGNRHLLRITLAQVGKHSLMLCCNGHIWDTENDAYCRPSPPLKNDDDGGAPVRPEASSPEMCDAEGTLVGLEASSYDTLDDHSPPSDESQEYYTPPYVHSPDYHTPPSHQSQHYHTPPYVHSPEELYSEYGDAEAYTWRDVFLDAGAVLYAMMTSVMAWQDLQG